MLLPVVLIFHAAGSICRLIPQDTSAPVLANTGRAKLKRKAPKADGKVQGRAKSRRTYYGRKKTKRMRRDIMMAKVGPDGASSNIDRHM